MCDPIDDPDLYAGVARESNMKIRYVIDTHLHADHVSGGRKLAEISGAEYVLHESADTQYAFRRVKDGEVLELGNVAIQVLHTPGHTPEHISLQVTDEVPPCLCPLTSSIKCRQASSSRSGLKSGCNSRQRIFCS